MNFARPPGPVGLEPDAEVAGPKPPDGQPIVGIAEGAETLANTPRITAVKRDWGDPPKPSLTFTPEIGGTTLKAALVELQRLAEWGSGGGNLSGTGPDGGIQISSEDGKSYTVELKGDFFVTLPKWKGYDQATAQQKQAWDNMIANLRMHEDEHVAIAYRGAQKLIRTLTNLPVDQALQKITDSQAETQKNQDDFDSAAQTDHGAKNFGRFKKVELDVSADPPPAPPPGPPKP